MVFTETDGGSQMPKYRGEWSEVGEKVREGGGKKKDGWFSRKAGHSTSSPVFGIEVICERDLLPVHAGW